jgi:integrase
MPYNHLLKIGSNYYFRCRIPKDLFRHFKTKEIKKSLKTNSYKTAKLAVKAYIYNLEHLFTIIRTGMLDDKQLKQILNTYKDDLLIGMERFRDAGDTAFEIWFQQAYNHNPIKWLDFNSDFNLIKHIFGDSDKAPDPKAAMDYYLKLIELNSISMGNFNYNSYTRQTAKKLVIDEGLDIELPPPEWFNENENCWFDRAPADFNKICRRVLQTQNECFAIEIERLKGNYENPYDVAIRERRPPCLLSELVEEFCRWRQMEKPANETTQRRFTQYLSTMLRILGDKDITLYTHNDLLGLKAKLFRWPKNVNKKKKYEGKSVAEIFAMPIEEYLDKRTINTNYMGKIASVFSYAYIHGKIDREISKYLVTSLTAAEKKARKRPPYNYDDLKIIFNNLPFDNSQPHLAWVPLIATYSGARQGEICQLLVTDIKEYKGIHYMHITEEDDDGNIVKNVKNESSKRLVPLHPTILDMGFLDFVNKKNKEGKVVIFATKGKKPLTGQYYSKRYQDFNNMYFKGTKKVFHSFRHTVHNELKQNGVQSDLYHSITGHAPQYEMDEVYTQEHKLENKYRALLSLEYPDMPLLDLRDKFYTLI